MKEIFFKNNVFNLFLIFWNLYIIVLKDCDKIIPILKDNECQLIYCEQSQFDTQECSINNTFIKTQWLNNIIRISDDYFRYINVVSNKKGDIFIETSPVNESSKRIFFGLKNNGRPYFKNEETPFYILDELSCNLKRHYSELINVVLKNNKEYLMSISTDGFAEIYDFDNNQRIYTDYPNFIQMNKTYTSILNSGCTYEYNNNYYIIYPFYVYSYYNTLGQNDYLYFHRLHFNDNINISDPKSYEKTNSIYYLMCLHGKIVSCFNSISHIYCFFHHYDYSYILKIYDFDLNYLGYFCPLATNAEDLYSFFKGVHLKDEIFALYYYPPSSKEYGHLLIATPQSPYLDPSECNTLNELINIQTKVKINNQLYYNDFIKIDENRLCITSVSGSDTQKIYIIIVNLFNEYKNARIYIYSIEFYKLYHYNVYNDVKLYLYNNFISYSSCICNDETCNTSAPFYSTLILFSYPNCSDTSIDLIEYLSNNTMNVSDFEINLTEYFKIDNNIFGYIFKYIKIINIFQSCSLKLIDKKDNSIISNNKELEENEILKLSYDETEILKGDYKIEYVGVATEPELYVYVNFPEDIDTNYQEGEIYNGLEDQIYTGKTSYYIINVFEDLSSDCLDACQLCYKINQTCIYKSDDIITESISITNEITNEQTDEKNIENTNEISDTKITEEISDEYTTESKSHISDSDLIYDNSDSVLNYSDEIWFQNNCTIGDIMNNYCNQKINTHQIKKTYKHIKEHILIQDYNKENVVIKTDNAAFQISKYNQQNTNNNTLSYIDIGDCEEIIKKKFNISKNDSLIILKADIKNKDLSATYVQYEIYEPYNLNKIELDICKNTTATIKTPTNLSHEAILLYDDLQKQGYNLFNSSDSFYNDICTRYTTQYGTDMIISDRKQLLDKYNDVPLCQADCTFEYYNISSNMTTCKCPMQIKNITLELINILFGRRDLLKSFYMTLSYSNFRVMKCFKLLFSKKGLISNIGSYILLVIILIFIILFNIYFFVEKKIIKKYIGIIIKEKYLLATKKYKQLKEKKKNNKHPKKGKDICQTMTFKANIKRKNERSLTSNSKSKNEKIKKTENKNKIRVKERLKTLNLSKINKTKSYNKNNRIKFNKEAPPKRCKCRKKLMEGNNLKICFNEEKSYNSKKQIKNTCVDIFSSPNSKSKLRSYSNHTKIYNANNIYKSSKNKKVQLANKHNSISNEKPVKKVMFNVKYNNTHSFQNNHINSKKLTKIIINNDFSSLTEYELDLLEYKNALKCDKRRAFKFYWSFLKRGNVLLFAILPYDDYNLRSIKISLLLISFSLYFTINGFFFTDDSMHKIYTNNGKYNLVNQIPQMIYSILVSTGVNSLLKLISLSGKDILLIKQQPTIEFALLKSKFVEKCLIIKIIIFYIVSFFCLLFYWYFISCFCAVYINTQFILIHDTLFSFATSMIYPCGYCLLPALMRSIALKSNKKNKKCLYNTSLLIS